MGLRKNKALKLPTLGLTRLLGSIHVNDQAEAREPFLLLKDGTRMLSLGIVTEAILANPDLEDRAIVAHINFNGLTPHDVRIVRAYLHRFGSDLTAPKDLPVEGKALLLDENTPPEAMLPLSKEFGWATHVQAEGLAGRDTPDAHILDFARYHRFQAVVTRDTDFLAMYRRGQSADCGPLPHIPKLIFVEGNLTCDTLREVFRIRGADLKDFMASGQHVCSAVSPAGYSFHHMF